MASSIHYTELVAPTTVGIFKDKLLFRFSVFFILILNTNLVFHWHSAVESCRHPCHLEMMSSFCLFFLFVGNLKEKLFYYHQDCVKVVLY